jgi:hypothetical protein
MSAPELASVLVRAVGLYLAIGVVFAVPFTLRWVARLDPVARTGTLGFRALIFPGSVALWPLLALRLVRARRPVA